MRARSSAKSRRAAVLGARGSFSESAARRLLGRRARLVRVASFDALFAAVASGRVPLAVVPVHNTIAGPVYDNAARAQAPPFRIVASTDLPVRQCLVARPGTALAGVRRVASHPVALRQCRRFFARHPGCATVAIADTASGVRDLVAGRLDADAVIASAEAAAMHGASVLLEGVQDTEHNVTTFVLVARRAVARSGPLAPRGVEVAR